MGRTGVVCGEGKGREGEGRGCLKEVLRGVQNREVLTHPPPPLCSALIKVHMRVM